MLTSDVSVSLPPSHLCQCPSPPHTSSQCPAVDVGLGGSCAAPPPCLTGKDRTRIRKSPVTAYTQTLHAKLPSEQMSSPGLPLRASLASVAACAYDRIRLRPSPILATHRRMPRQMRRQAEASARVACDLRLNLPPHATLVAVATRSTSPRDPAV